MTMINYCPNCGKSVNSNEKFCTKCGEKITEDTSNNNKREKVLKGKNNSNRKGIYVGLASFISVSALIIYLNVQPSKEEAIIDSQPKVSENIKYPSLRYDHAYSIAFARDGKIILPLDVVKEKKFVKFDYIGGNKTIPLLAYLTEDGKIVTSISLCEPCDSKDFHIQGNNLICNSCGTTWDLNNLDAISGSCGKYPPDPVPSKVVGNEIQIDEYIVTGWVRRV